MKNQITTTKYDKKSIYGCFIVDTISQRKQYSIRDIYTHLAQFDTKYEFIYIHICIHIYPHYIYIYIKLHKYSDIDYIQMHNDMLELFWQT